MRTGNLGDIFLVQNSNNFLFYYFRELESTLSNIAIQIIVDVKESSAAHGLPELSEEVEVLMKNDIADIAKPDYRIKQLVRKYDL